MNTRRAFTLVEILTVTVIISILVALVTLAVAGAMRAAKRARIAWAMNQIELAIEHYKAEFGEYPPDFFDDDALIRHVRKRWPRFEPPTGDNHDIASKLRHAMAMVYQNSDFYKQEVLTEWTGQQNPSFNFAEGGADISSLILWLGGFANPEGRFEGFSADPEAPFGRDKANTINKGDANDVDVNTLKIVAPDKKVFMEMEINKNVFFFNTLGVDQVAPCLGTKFGSKILPIIYFRGSASSGFDPYYDYRDSPPLGIPTPRIKAYDFSSSSGIPAGGTSPGSEWRDCGVVVPYGKSGIFDADPANSTVVWGNPTTYQLIHPGLDGKFGTAEDNQIQSYYRSIGVDPTSALGSQDLDNLTNFSDYKELKSILP